MKFVKAVEVWHRTKPGLLVFALVELALAYAFVSWAIDTGSLLDYFCAIVLIIGGVQNLGKLASLLLKGRVRHAAE